MSEVDSELVKQILKATAELQSKVAFLERLVSDKLMDEILELKVARMNIQRDMQGLAGALSELQAAGGGDFEPDDDAPPDFIPGPGAVASGAPKPTPRDGHKRAKREA